MAGKLPALNSRQELFVESMAEGANATQAAIKAGYSPKSARQQGFQLQTNPAIIAALQARRVSSLARLEVTEDMVLSELAAIAFSNIKRFTRWTKDGELELLDSGEIPDGLACAIESIDERVLVTTNKDGSRSYTVKNRKVKLYSKLDALGKLADYLGLTDSLTPKVVVHVVTGIQRDQLPAAKAPPLAMTVEPE